VEKTRNPFSIFKNIFSILILFFLLFYLSSNFYSQSQKYILIDQSDYYYKNGDYEKSLKILIKAKTIYKNNKNIEIEILTRLGLLFWNNGDLIESLNYYKKALALTKELKLSDKTDKIQKIIDIYNYYNKGKLFKQIGKNKESIDSFRKAIIIAKQVNSIEHEIKCIRQLSAVYYLLDDKKNFSRLINESYQKAIDINFEREEGYSAFNLGLYYWSIDDYSKAFHYFNISYNISLKFDDKEDQSESLMSIGIVYRDMGLYEKALEYLFSALKINKKINNNIQIIYDLNNIGIIYRKRGYLNNNINDFNSALGFYTQALNLAIKTNNFIYESRILNNIGSLLTYINKNNEAIEYLKKAYFKARAINDFETMSSSLNNMGIVNTNLGNYNESIKNYKESINLAQKMNRRQTLWEAYFEMGDSYKRQNKNYLAINSYKISISIIEDIRAKINQEEYRTSYLGTDKRLEVYHGLIDLLVFMNKIKPDQQFNDDSFYYQERAKARSFLDSLEVSNIDIDKGINFKLISHEKEILNDISHLYLNLLNDDLPLKEKISLNDELKRKEEEYDSLKREIRANSPSYAGIKYPDIIKFKDSQKLLPNSRTAFIAYCLGKSNGYAFVVTKKRLKIFSIPGSQQLQMKISLHLKNLTDKENHDFKLSHELYSLLVYPGLDREIKTIIFCPDDILNYLPFETLLFSPNNNDWLIKKYNVSYAPSISSLRELVLRERRDHPKLSKDIFLAGDPDYGEHEVSTDMESGSLEGFYNGTPIKLGRLEFSSLELKKISALFNKNKFSSFYKKEANEQLLKTKNLNGYKIIHLAAHTLIDDRNPGRSSIILSLNQNSEEDGFLQMREIFNLRMNADLVTLSACDTGLGQLIRGEGIVGLNRAFFFAGANAVLMSLWAVHDEASSQLMERFYYHLKKGTSISNALRSAKIEMIGSRNLSHPYYWAGFVISGDANQIIFSKKSVLWIPLLVLSIATAFVLLFLLIGRKKKKY
jgi:CHAT domain-containing protein